ncbi:LexA family protein, partial [Eubacterium sp.]|uniref:LexA family protein n=1 Tax=Eubacterium sp. TaxID=142586 RepID=UPI002A8195E7
GNEATVKKIRKFDGGINLIPTNSNYDVITYTNAQIEQLPVRIIGKVVELRAKF